MTNVSNRIKQKLEDILKSSDGYKIQEITEYNYGITCVKYRKKFKSSKRSLKCPSAISTFGLSLPLRVHNMIRDSWHYCYFDTISEDFLGETQDEAAVTISKKGFESVENGKFEEAKELFNKAFSICVNNDPNRENFVNYIDAMDFAMEGKNHLKDGQFAEAIEKFQLAHNIFYNVSEICRTFSNCKNTANTAFEALDLAISKRYSEASEKFEKAQVQSNIDEIKTYFSNYKEVVNTIINAHKLLAEHRIKDAEELLCTALGKTSCTVVNKIISNELDNVGRKGEEEEAAKFYEEGTILWQDAWIAENNQEAYNAHRVFQMAKNKFEEAYNLNHNPNYNKWILIVHYKIKGNELFNMGIEQQEMGNNLNERELYQDAYNMYEKSKHCFQEGYNLSGDQKFMPSIEFVEKLKNEIKKIIQNIPTNTHVANLSFVNGESNTI